MYSMVIRQFILYLYAAGGADVLNDSCALDRVAEAMLHHSSLPGTTNNLHL